MCKLIYPEYPLVTWVRWHFTASVLHTKTWTLILSLHRQNISTLVFHFYILFASCNNSVPQTGKPQYDVVGLVLNCRKNCHLLLSAKQKFLLVVFAFSSPCTFIVYYLFFQCSYWWKCHLHMMCAGVQSKSCCITKLNLSSVFVFVKNETTIWYKNKFIQWQFITKTIQKKC